MNILKPLFISAFLVLSLAGCDDGKAENMGEEIDQKMNDAGDAIEDAANDAGNAIEDACEDATKENC